MTQKIFPPPVAGLVIFFLTLSTSLRAQQHNDAPDFWRYGDGSVPVESPGNKLTGKWKNYKTRQLELLNGYESQKPVETGIYGGRMDRDTEKATGFFYVKKVGNRWWMIDPEGRLYFNMAVNAVRATKVSPASQDAFKEKFGSEKIWGERTVDFLRETGFMGLGNWSHDKILRETSKPLPYMIRKDFMSSFAKGKGLTQPASGHTGYINECFPVFIPDFEEFCDNYAKDLAATAADPYVVGIFSDNELLAPKDLLDRHLKLDATQANLKHGYDAAAAWLKERGKNETAIDDKDRAEFLAYVFERYYRIVSAAIKKYDPNHMYAGSRVNNRKTQFANESLWKVMGKYLDVISVNDYSVWGPDPKEDANWEAWSQKPVMITEWYAKALDTPGLANQFGAGWVVKTQEDRGKFYQHFMLGCLESGNIVGSHYFKYMDDPSESTALDCAGGTNKGLLDTKMEPYAPLVERARAVNTQIYSLIDFFDKRKQ